MVCNLLLFRANGENCLVVDFLLLFFLAGVGGGEVLKKVGINGWVGFLFLGLLLGCLILNAGKARHSHVKSCIFLGVARGMNP